MTPRELIRRWVEHFNARDVDGLAAMYHVDAVNHQVALEPVVGRDAITRMFADGFTAAEMVCIVENIFEEGEWGILEWKDPLGLRGCGFFHFREGLITLQRGYWDKATFERVQSEARAERTIRAYRHEDFEDVVGVWHRSGIAAYTYIPTWQSLTIDGARDVFRDHVLPGSMIWVGMAGSRLVALLVMKGSYLDRLYVDPAEWGIGWGRKLVEFAKEQSPQGLELHTHQQNHRGRTLYERCGFVAVRFGVSPPPESIPDVEYQWRP